MTTTTFNPEPKRHLQFQLRISENNLEKNDTKICAMLVEFPEGFSKLPQTFITDDNPDYINPLILKDNSSRIQLLHHIEEAELLAENNSNYIMQPLPSVERIAWTLKPQIPIKSYELSPNLDLEPHSLLLTQSSETNLFPPSVPAVSSKEKEHFNLLPPIQEETDKEFTFKEFLPAVNATVCGLSTIGAADVKTTELQNTNHKLVDIFRSEAVDFEHSNTNSLICPNDSSITDEIGVYDFGDPDGKRNEKLNNIPVNQSEHDNSNNIFPQNVSRQREIRANENTNIKFQYAKLTNGNYEKERELSISEDCISMVCKECGFEEYI